MRQALLLACANVVTSWIRAVKPVSKQPDAEATQSNPTDWTTHRSIRRPGWLVGAALMFLIWIGFLLTMAFRS